MASHADKDRTAEVLELLQSKGDLYAKTSLFEKKRSTDLEEAIDHIVILSIYSLSSSFFMLCWLR